MKHKLLAFLLCIVLLAALVPTAPTAAVGKLTYISINDTLPPELVNCVSFSGSTAFVPYSVFSNYGLGFSAAISSADGTLELRSGEKSLFFNVADNSCYDGDDYHYSVSAFSRNGIIYVPLGFVSRFFGTVSYSSISGNEYGSILRITNSNVVLTDSEFLRAAESAMKTLYNNYQTGIGISPLSPGSDEPTHQNDRLLMCFTGIPSDAVLTLLAQNKIKATVFLRAQDILEQPDTVRRIYCDGHALGVYCESDLAMEYEEASALLFEACRVSTVLVTAPESYAEACREQAEMAGLVYCGYDMDLSGSGYKTTSAFNIFTQLNNRVGGATLHVSGEADDATKLRQLLIYLSPAQFDMDYRRETD